jgi:hypothetical protein
MSATDADLGQIESNRTTSDGLVDQLVDVVSRRRARHAWLRPFGPADALPQSFGEDRSGPTSVSRLDVGRIAVRQDTEAKPSIVYSAHTIARQTVARERVCNVRPRRPGRKPFEASW